MGYKLKNFRPWKRKLAGGAQDLNTFTPPTPSTNSIHYFKITLNNKTIHFTLNVQ